MSGSKSTSRTVGLLAAISLVACSGVAGQRRITDGGADAAGTASDARTGAESGTRTDAATGPETSIIVVPDPGTLGGDCSQSQPCNDTLECLGIGDSGGVCTRPCASDADCDFLRCLELSVGMSGGTPMTQSMCVDPARLGTPCVNFDSADNPDATLQCTTEGQFCNPFTATSPDGICTDGEGCDPVAGTGCTSGKGCFPVTLFALDNTDATVCLTVGRTRVGASCSPRASPSPCVAGAICLPTSSTAGVCAKICNRDRANADCTGVTSPGGSGAATCEVPFDSTVPEWMQNSRFGLCL